MAALRNDRLTENSGPILFRSYPAPCSEFELQDTKIWEAIRATSAAPRVFKPITIGGIEWVDAALGFNDPGPEVLDEARKIWPGREIGAFLSLGAGKRSPVENKRRYGLVRSFTNTLNAMKSITTDTQRAIAYLNRELGPDVLFRFSVDEGLGDIHIAKWQMLKDFEARTNKYLDKPECLKRVNILVQRIISDGESMYENLLSSNTVSSADGVFPQTTSNPSSSKVYRLLMYVYSPLLNASMIVLFSYPKVMDGGSIATVYHLDLTVVI